MAENQYIGARYVPKFFANPNGSSEWLGNVPYEPLTIVTYLGNSYTSKIPVPPRIGNPSLNPTYWALTGNFNAQYDEVLKEIADNSTNISLLEDEVDALKIKKGNENIVLITDSYGTRYTGVTKPYVLNFANYIGHTINSDFFYSAKGGAGFIADGSNTFLALLTTMANEWSYPIKKNEITDIIVAGGCNDRGKSESSIITAMTSFLNYAKAQFPNAKVHSAMIGGFNTVTNRTQLAISSLLAYNHCPGFFQLPNLCHVMQNSSLFIEDNVHPNQTGQNEIAHALASAWVKGYNCIVSPTISNIVLSDIFNTTNKMVEHVQATNEFLSLEMYTNGFLELATPATWSGNITIGKTTSPYFLGILDFQTTCNCVFSGSIKKTCTICVNNGVVLLSMPEAVQNVTSFGMNRCVLTMQRSYS